jgi:hypothetical protein|tara:strand:- start:810 stop:1292 length:483 start_codon:yes stop_codon:yes gene_type:complete
MATYFGDREIPDPSQAWRFGFGYLRKLIRDIDNDISYLQEHIVPSVEWTVTSGRASIESLSYKLEMAYQALFAKIDEEPEMATLSELAGSIADLELKLETESSKWCEHGLQEAKDSLDLLKRWHARRLHEMEEAHADDLIEALAHEAKQQQEITELDLPF